MLERIANYLSSFLSAAASPDPFLANIAALSKEEVAELNNAFLEVLKGYAVNLATTLGDKNLAHQVLLIQQLHQSFKVMNAPRTFSEADDILLYYFKPEMVKKIDAELDAAKMKASTASSETDSLIASGDENNNEAGLVARQAEIQAQAKWVIEFNNARSGLLTAVKNEFIKRHPAAASMDQAASRLKNFRQFALCLAADAIVQLHVKLQARQNITGHDSLIDRINAAVINTNNDPFLPYANKPVLNKKNDVQQFFADLASGKRRLAASAAPVSVPQTFPGLTLEASPEGDHTLHAAVKRYLNSATIENAVGEVAAEDLDLEALEDFLERPIFVVNAVGASDFGDVTRHTGGEPIFVCLQEDRHYDALILNAGNMGPAVLAGLIARNNEIQDAARPDSQRLTVVAGSTGRARASSRDSNVPEGGILSVPPVANGSRAPITKLAQKRNLRAMSGTYPMPAYLAKSMMMHLGTAIKNHADAMEKELREARTLVTQEYQDRTVTKVAGMRAAAQWLSGQSTAPKEMLQTIYNEQITFSNHTGTRVTLSIKSILETKRDPNGYNPDTLMSVLGKAGQAFLQENSESLMRRYVLLTQFLAVMDALPEKERNKASDLINGAEAHLDNTASAMKPLRKDVMKTLYPKKGVNVSEEDIRNSIDILIGREKDSADDALLIRYLLIACLDKLSDKEFTALTSKEAIWNLSGFDVNKEEMPTNRIDFIKALAKNIADPYALVTSLLELTYFQHKSHEKGYTAKTHLQEILPALIHLTKCLEYFEKRNSKEKTPVSTLAIFDAASSTIMQTMEEFSDTISAEKIRLRLSVTLQRYLQAALACGLETDPITAITLGVISGGTAEEIEAWFKALKENDSSCLAKVNLGMMSKDLSSLWAHIAGLSTLEEKIKFYDTMVMFAEVLLRHVQREQTKSNRVNPNIIALCKLMQGGMAHLQTLVPKGKEESLKAVVGSFYGRNTKRERELSFDKLTQFDKALTTETANQGPLERHVVGATDSPSLPATQKYIKDSIVPHYLNSKTLMKLAERAKAFDTGLVGVCSQEETTLSESVKAIRTEVYPDSNDPRLSVFEAVFEQKLASNEDESEFFTKALFTPTYHPFVKATEENPNAAEEYAKFLCGRIAGVSPNQTREYSDWSYFRTENKFYNNSKALSHLFDAYLQKNAEIALRIAIFSLSDLNSKFTPEEKLQFAQSVLFAFEKLAKTKTSAEIAARPDIIYLQNALAILDKDSRFIPSNERQAINALNGISEFLILNRPTSEIAELHGNLLHKAEEQEVVQKTSAGYDAKTLLGLSTTRTAEVAHQSAKEVDDLAVDIAMNTGTNRDAQIQEYDIAAGDIRELDRLITDMARICFPLGKRYYNYAKDDANVSIVTKENKKDHKISDRSESGRDQLIQRCRVKMSDLLKNGTLNRATLVEAMKALRAEVLEGGYEGPLNPEDRQPAPHEMNQLEFPRDFGYSQTDDFINGMQRKINALVEAINLKKSQAAPNRRASQRVRSMRIPAGALGLQQALQSDIEQAVLDAVDWLKDSPTLDNIPVSVTSVVGAENITDAIIAHYRNLILSLGTHNEFAHRVRLIRKSEFNACIDHCLRWEMPVAAADNNYQELVKFIQELQARTSVTHAQHDPRYAQNLDEFVWATAERAVSENNGGPDDARLFDTLENCGYGWEKLIALGFKRYASLSDAERIAAAGTQLLFTIAYLAKNLEKFEVANTSQDPHVVRMAKISIEALQKFRNGDNAFFNNGSATYSYQKQRVYGAQLYYHIYTLAQAYMAAPGLKQENSAAAPQPSDVAKFKETSKKAPVLLNHLHQLLSDENSTQLHQKMLTVGREYPSSLHVLVRGSEHGDALHHQQLINPQATIDSERVELRNRAPIWTESYNIRTRDSIKQAAFTAKTADHLNRTHQAGEFKEMVTTIRLQDGQVVTQKDSIIEQQAFVFMVANHWYTKNETSPFYHGLLLSTAGDVNKANELIKHLLQRAYHSFNRTTMNPDWVQKHLQSKDDLVLRDKALTLLNLANQDMTRPENRWLQLFFPVAAPEVTKFYVDQALNDSEFKIQSKDHADLLFAMFKGKVSDNKEQPRANANETKLLFKAFEWMESYLEKGRSTGKFESRLESLKTKLSANHLWNDYYAYVAHSMIEARPVKFYPKNMTDLACDKHANELLVALQQHPCHDVGVQEKVKENILENWRAYITMRKTPEEGKKFLYKKGFDLAHLCGVWDMKINNVAMSKAAISQQYRTAVADLPEVVSEVYESFKSSCRRILENVSPQPVGANAENGTNGVSITTNNLHRTSRDGTENPILASSATPK